MLNSHPGVVAYSELYLATRKDHPMWGGDRDVTLWNAYWRREKANLKTALRKVHLCHRYLDGIYSADGESVQAVGFKLMYNQLRQNSAGLLTYLLRNRVALVHLVRTNHLDVILSEEAVRIRKRPHAYGEVENVQIDLNPTVLLRRLRRKARKVRWARCVLSHLGLPYFEVRYEELVSGDVGFDAILSFLGIASGYRALNTRFQRLNKGTHRDLIRNYDEVAKLLATTKYSDLLL